MKINIEELRKTVRWLICEWAMGKKRNWYNKTAAPWSALRDFLCQGSGTYGCTLFPFTQRPIEDKPCVCVCVCVYVFVFNTLQGPFS